MACFATLLKHYSRVASAVSGKQGDQFSVDEPFQILWVEMGGRCGEGRSE